MKKGIKILPIILFLMISFANITFAGNWVKIGDNWRYERHKGGGDYIYERWFQDVNGGEKVYYFDYYGNMVTGPVVIDGVLYIYADTGEAITTGFEIDGINYVTDGKGRVLGLPEFFDTSRFPTAYTETSVRIARIEATPKTLYDDNNNIEPTATTD